MRPQTRYVPATLAFNSYAARAGPGTSSDGAPTADVMKPPEEALGSLSITKPPESAPSSASRYTPEPASRVPILVTRGLQLNEAASRLSPAAIAGLTGFTRGPLGAAQCPSTKRSSLALCGLAGCA